MFRKLIGKRSKKHRNTIERGAVKKFAEAIGDPHPIFIDEKVGTESRYKTNIAPVTFPRVLNYGVIEGLQLPKKGLIHGEELYHYERPLLVNEEILCYQEVEDYYDKSSNSGELGFLVLKSYGEDVSGNIVFTAKSTIVFNAALRKEMNR
ncbi:MaoC family dehydratase N-terminal domain-containing protein [Bacillus sp. SM2101]|uniref:MaoC family dehydratase N-terminal domain-containing protein n=1 Tax=Bacillus sp. SM2101 TaxID=2805366 RepID=UPI001BDE6CC3|nr:MaoC family dehydratase N-terminal domain-containing protein [Bacillus sp. SM2101]